jgi:hypothetical protein
VQKSIPKLLVLFVTVLLASAMASAQDDWHLSKNGNPALFLRSAFAHGYMHGYEEGFHEGDLDLQMGHPFHPVKEQERFKKVSGYRDVFGNQGSFSNGYRKGYAVGYTDSYAGRNFRAIQLVREARLQPLPATAAAPDPQFDHAFMLGYNAGQTSGLNDGRAAAPLADLHSINCSKVTDNEDCAAYRQGYWLGYSDGYTNQNETGAVLAEK